MSLHATTLSTLDPHLILNGLGRVSARYYAATRQECAEIFALSDYVGLGLRLMGQPSCTCDEAAELLQAYLTLHTACKYRQLEVHINNQEPDLTGHLPPHLACDLARCLIEWLRAEPVQQWSLHAELQSDSVQLLLRSNIQSPLPLTALENAVAQFRNGLAVAHQAEWRLSVSVPAIPSDGPGLVVCVKAHRQHN
jgi:hypothetical protein